MSKKSAAKRIAKAQVTAQDAEPRTPRMLAEALAEVDGLIHARRWDAARDKLEDLDLHIPNRRDVLDRLARVYAEVGTEQERAEVYERLSRLAPNDADLARALADAYLAAGYPFLARQHFHRFAQRWPDHPDTVAIQNTLGYLDPLAAELLDEFELTGDHAFELGQLTDQARFLVRKGDRPRARQAIMQILRLRPGLPAALDNLAQIEAAEGHLDRAIAAERQARENAPDDPLVLASLTIFLVRFGQLDEARAVAAKLKLVEPKRPSDWTNLAEALAYLGDDEGVLAVSERARQRGGFDEPERAALLEHYTAVAMARLGRAGEARFHWGETLKAAPGFAPAEENRADLKAPVEARNGPWAFTIGQWIAPPILVEVAETVERAAGDKAVSEVLRRVAARHPELVRLAPALLDRGDPAARDFALHLASAVRSPELLSVLRDFALGQRGTDANRLRALGVLEEAKALGSEPIRVWQEGEWREIIPLTFEIHDEPTRTYPRQIQTLLNEVSDLLHHQRAEEALPVIARAMELAPEVPSLQHNLAMAYTMLGRKDDAETLIRRLARVYPEYFFGQLGLAQLEARAHRTEAAHAILESLTGRPRYHRSEFIGLALAEIEVLLAEKNPQGARSWLDVLASIDPEHPSILHLRDIIKRAR